MKLTRAFHSAIVQVLLAGGRTREAIGTVDSRFQAKKLVTVGAFLERPGTMNGDGELANHGAKQTGGTEDEVRPTILLRPVHAQCNRLLHHLQFSQPLLDGMTEEPEGGAAKIARLEEG
jgi:hypothetical protein